MCPPRPKRGRVIAQLNLEEYRHKRVTLLYLFWEPENRKDHELFRKHRNEIKEFESRLKGTGVEFQAMSYPELWDEWLRIDMSGELTENLRQRYLIQI